MSQFKTQVKLNVLPLGYYDVLIGMDWLENHQVILICFQKTFTCLIDKGEKILVKGIPSVTSPFYLDPKTNTVSKIAL